MLRFIVVFLFIGFSTNSYCQVEQKQMDQNTISSARDSISVRIIISYTVDTTGANKDIKVIDVKYGKIKPDSLTIQSFKTEAIRLISQMPPKKPKIENGKKIEERKVMPILFNLKNNKTE